MLETKRGFTLVELLVVLGIFSVALGSALLVSMETFRGASFRTERNTVIALLQRARAQSVSNYCVGTCSDGMPHGVAIRPPDNPDAYVLFQGRNYASRDVATDAVFEATMSITTSGLSEVVFSQHAATTTVVGGRELVLSDSSGHVSTTTIGVEGQISWTN